MKTILVTFTVTIAAVFLAANFFLNSILGVFGLAATSVETLQGLQASQQVVNRMVNRHKSKKVKVTKRFAKKASGRVASTALAAATIGTIAVVVTMTALEVEDYCEEKQELQEDENLLNGTQVEFDYKQCYEAGIEDTKFIYNELKNSSVKALSTAFNSTAQYSSTKWNAIKEAGMEAMQSSGTAASNLWDSTKSWFVD